MARKPLHPLYMQFLLRLALPLPRLEQEGLIDGVVTWLAEEQELAEAVRMLGDSELRQYMYHLRMELIASYPAPRAPARRRK